ncbi:MAG: flavohemoglobin expression-modulating QEGLA motif protein [Nannocystaceae bacterium]|nr:DUF1704 domain-containing protein [Myxococcales bacterium]
MVSEARAQRITESAKALRDAHKRLLVLKLIAWPPRVRKRFFATGEREMPEVDLPALDPRPALELIAHARRKAPRDPVIGAWLRRQADALEQTARMLGAIGTAEFSEFSQRLYGRPKDRFPRTERTPLELAGRLIQTARRLSGRLPDPPPPTFTAQEVAAEIQTAVNHHFGSKAPRVEVVKALIARASAAPSRIRIRESARFSDLDIRQLIQHEAYVHVATALNGRRNPAVPILAEGHPGTTRTQEGLAVFAEMMSGSLDPRRLLRLAHRVVGIQMALDGADFLAVYRYFVEHAPNRREAFENAARIFRGGLLEGGGPFTKDMVYLDGLCRVHVFIRAVMDTGRVDCLEVLFAGKLDLGDIPALIALRGAGLCRAPRFLPPWVTDPRRMVAHFAVTDIISRTSSAGLRKHYVEWLREQEVIPPVEPRPEVVELEQTTFEWR